MSGSIARHLKRLAGMVDAILIEDVSRLLMQGNGDQAAMLLARGNSKTREDFWSQRINGKPTAHPDLEASEWNLMRDAAGTIPRHLQGRCLEMALMHAKIDCAMALIDIGAPCGRHVGRQIDTHPHGAMAHLMYGDYPRLTQEQTIALATRMMDRYGNEALSAFNPGSVTNHGALSAFLERAPRAHDKRAWRESFVWQPADFVRHQASSERAGHDPRNVILLLEAGFPGEPIDLLARALINNRQDVARALLDWPGFVIRQASNACPTAWDITTEKPVMAEGFWHALADGWAEVERARQMYGWTKQAPWPDDDILERLADIEMLDPLATNPDGFTPDQVAKQIFGSAGPMAKVAPLREQRRLERSTKQAAEKHRRGHRL